MNIVSVQIRRTYVYYIFVHGRYVIYARVCCPSNDVSLIKTPLPVDFNRNSARACVYTICVLARTLAETQNQLVYKRRP